MSAATLAPIVPHSASNPFVPSTLREQHPSPFPLPNLPCGSKIGFHLFFFFYGIPPYLTLSNPVGFWTPEMSEGITKPFV